MGQSAVSAEPLLLFFSMRETSRFSLDGKDHLSGKPIVGR